MAGTRYRKGQPYAADMAVYARLMAEDNSEEMGRVKVTLARALREEITPRHRELPLLYSGPGMNLRQNCVQSGIHCPTGSTP